jgi:hypothetical protein
MTIMFRFRRTRKPTELLTEFSFLRTIQSPSHTVWDDLHKQYRLSSKAFSPSASDKTVSGDLEQLLLADEVPISKFKSSLRRVVALYAIQVEKIHIQQLVVSHLPVPTNWYHGGISGKITDKVKRKLKDEAVPIIGIDQALAASYHGAALEVLSHNGSLET